MKFTISLDGFVLRDFLKIFITGNQPFFRMSRAVKQSGRQKKIFIESLPELIDAVLADDQDFILTAETDPDTGARRIHAFSGKFISSCMLRKLLGFAEAQRDEGSRVITCEWK
jgi:hypothetical protein